ncbi:hypothetical protein ACWEOZ_23885 [Actinoplanes sp. NPDC004185]
MALHDPGEVQTAGGMVEAYRQVDSTAAHALKQILDRQDGLDERIREVAFDLTQDDDSIGKLRAEVRISLTRSRGDDSRELTWDAVEVSGGGHG